jgi:hypothetical protein
MRTKCYVLNENESCRDYLGATNFKGNDNFSIENELKIEVYKGARTFGLALRGGVNDQRSPGNSSIYVEKVLEGGLAEKDGRIMPGDQITAIKQYLEDGDARTYNFDDYGTATKELACTPMSLTAIGMCLHVIQESKIQKTPRGTLSSYTTAPRRRES